MKKELEELWENVYKNGYQIKNVEGTYYYVKDNVIQGIVNVNSIQQALTPPTADKICKALSEYYNKKVVFNDERFFIKTDKYIEQININALMRNVPHLITMIGKFYEGIDSDE